MWFLIFNHPSPDKKPEYAPLVWTNDQLIERDVYNNVYQSKFEINSLFLKNDTK